MASSEEQLCVETLGPRQKAIKFNVEVVVTAGADTTSTTTYTYENPFVDPPQIMGVNSTDPLLNKVNVTATAVTAVDMDVNIYQVLALDLASGTYVVEVNAVGWVAA